MHMRLRALPSVALIVVVASLLGCGGDDPAKGKAPALTPAEYFKERQVKTMTPHGKIVTESVEEKDGKIQYKTQDGKQWRVGHSKRADGTYQYGMPEEIK